MSQIVSDPEYYFSQFIPQREELLLRLEDEARKEGIPIIGPLMGEILYILVKATRSERILELGTATGYSAIFMARACESLNGRVFTLEHDSNFAARARENFRLAGLDTRIELREQGALQALPCLEDRIFDFIFLDIDKEHYFPALPHCERILRKNGLLVVDNTGFALADEFNQTLFQSSNWRVAQLFSFLPAHSPEKDGWCMALKQ